MSSATSKPRRARRGRPSQDESAARIEEMLDTATRMFGAQGYALTTVERVSRELRMSKNTIYARYPNKTALFLAVVERIANSPLLEAVTDDDDLPLEEGLLVRARSILLAALRPEFGALYRLLLRDSGRFPEVEAMFGKVFFDRLEQPVRIYIGRKREADDSYSIPLDRAAHLFMTTLNAYIFDYTLRPEHAAVAVVERDAAEAVTYFLHGASGRAIA